MNAYIIRRYRPSAILKASWIFAFLVCMALPVSAPAVCIDERAANASIVRSNTTIPANNKFFFPNLRIICSSGYRAGPSPARCDLIAPLRKNPTIRFNRKGNKAWQLAIGSWQLAVGDRQRQDKDNGECVCRHGRCRSCCRSRCRRRSRCQLPIANCQLPCHYRLFIDAGRSVGAE